MSVLSDILTIICDRNHMVFVKGTQLVVTNARFDDRIFCIKTTIAQFNKTNFDM